MVSTSKFVKPVRTRFLSNSHPIPPAPTTKILHCDTLVAMSLGSAAAAAADASTAASDPTTAIMIELTIKSSKKLTISRSNNRSNELYQTVPKAPKIQTYKKKMRHTNIHNICTKLIILAKSFVLLEDFLGVKMGQGNEGEVMGKRLKHPWTDSLSDIN